MKRSSLATLLICLPLLFLAVCTPVARAAEETPPPTATQETNTAAKIVNSPDPQQPQMDSTLAQFVQWIVSWFAWMLGLAAIMLDYAVLHTVVKMGTYVNGLSAIGVVWRIFRDIGNIALIFGFLAIGISIILDDAVKFGYNKNMLPTLLIVAVTLNFSLFAAEAVIDAGNLFATQIYQQIRGGEAAGMAAAAGIGNEGISNRVMAQLGLQKMYGDALVNTQLYNSNNSLIVGLLSIILFLVAAFIFFSLALILIFRFVALIFIIMTSPIGVAGLVVPKLGPTASKWWGELTNQTLTAPVLLLLLYVSLAVITDVNFLTGFGASANDGWLQTFGQAGAATVSMVLSFIVAMALLGRVATTAKSMGAAGADIAMNVGQKMAFGGAARAVGGLTNLAGYAARRGIQASGYTGPGSRLAMRGALLAQGARMDIRNVPGVGAGLKLAGMEAAAKPVGTSVNQVRTGLQEKYKATQKAAGKAYEAEMRVPLLLQETDPSKQAKLLNSMTDDELKSDAITKFFADNPNAIKGLAPNKITAVDPSVLTKENSLVPAQLTGRQLEQLRTQGNFDEPTARAIGWNLGRGSRDYSVLYWGSRNDKQTELQTFWGFVPPRP